MRNMQGSRIKSIEMNFLPDVYVLCAMNVMANDITGETLEIRFKGKIYKRYS